MFKLKALQPRPRSENGSSNGYQLPICSFTVHSIDTACYPTNLYSDDWAIQPGEDIDMSNCTICSHLLSASESFIKLA